MIFFDIQLNTGALNGFLFFMQVLSIFNLTANNIIKVPKITENFLTALYSVIKTFNLDFFVIPGLDFCLFKGANPLDLLSFDYVLVVYLLLLVLFTITCLNRRCTTRVKRLRGRRILRTSSIIHGLSCRVLGPVLCENNHSNPQDPYACLHSRQRITSI